MDIGIVSARYAKALLKFAGQNGEDVKVYEEMQSLVLAFLKIEKLHHVLLSPTLTEEQKTALLLSAMGGEDVVCASTKKFVKLVVQKKRSPFMLFIANAYIARYRKLRGIVKGKLILPSHMSEQIETRLQKLVEARAGAKVDFDVCVDEDLLGGFILEYDTYRLDASLRTSLERLHRALL